MTGRDLIIYILENNLEDKPVFEDGKFIGFMTPEEAAELLDTGSATILALANLGKIDSEWVDGGVYIPAKGANKHAQTRGDCINVGQCI